MTKTVISGTSNNNTFGLEYLLVRSMFRRRLSIERARACLPLFISATRPRRGEESRDRFWGHLRETAEMNDVVIKGR